MHMGLQYILIVIWYTFSDFYISNKSGASAAAKIKKIFEITPQMYMYKKLILEWHKIECHIQYSIFRTMFRIRIVRVNAAFKTP